MEFVKEFESYENVSLVVGCFEEEKLLESKYFEGVNCGFNLSVGSVNYVYTFEKLPYKKLYVIGLGKKEEYNFKKRRKVFSKLCKLNEEKLTIEVDSFGDYLEEIVLELSYGSYQFLECFSNKKEKELLVKLETVKNYEEALVLGTSINNTRDLVNKPYNYLNSIDLANYSKELVESFENENVSITIYDKKDIEEMKMGAFLGVNKGSSVEPRLIYIKYNGDKNTDEYIGLVGKGVMFDTGGYSLKSNMVNMKCDMAGSATVLGVIEALVNNNVKANVCVVICATDNKMGPEGLLPDDVVVSYSGKTIEIVSTDAEGRLTLADGLTFIQEQNCRKVIDVATLTGACVSALGDYITGLFGNNQDMIDEFIDVSKKTSEDVWQLPINDYIKEKVRSSKVADLTNSTGPKMGASGAASFLEAFINEGVSWLHLDIAGTAFHTAPLEYEYYGGTGCMVKTIYEYVKSVFNK